MIDLISTQAIVAQIIQMTYIVQPRGHEIAKCCSILVVFNENVY